MTCPHETYLFTAAARFLRDEPIADGGSLGVEAGLRGLGFDLDSLYEQLRDTAFSYMDEYALGEGKTRWAEKTAVNVYYADAFDSLLGDDVTYVCIVRHGLDVACSMRDMTERSETYLEELHTYVRNTPRPLEGFCHAWVEACQQIRRLEERRAERVVVVRYEDLIADPDTTMSKIATHIGSTWQPEWREDAFKTASDAGLGDWKTYRTTDITSKSLARWKELSSSTIGRLADIVNPTMAEWDYEPIRTRKPVSAAEAQRRFNLAVNLSRFRDA